MDSVLIIAEKISKELDPFAVLLPIAGLKKITKDLCGCGAESDYGAHGIKDGEVYSEYFCEKCWNQRK